MHTVTAPGCQVQSNPSLYIEPDPLSPFRKVREGLADVISVYKFLNNQILRFSFELVATPWQKLVLVQLQIKQAVNNDIC